MQLKIITPSMILTISLSLLMLMFSALGSTAESVLEFNRVAIMQGEYWRLLSGHFVHYGLAHLAMNVAAFLLVGFSFLRDLSVKNYLILFIFCALAVGVGVFQFNVDLFFYRGLSGILHGLIVAGLLHNSFRHRGLSIVSVGLVFAKIIHEQQADFQANQLQQLLPVMIAVDAHLYGAIAGLCYGLILLLLQTFKKKSQ